MRFGVIYTAFVVLLLVSSCGGDYAPKPRGYFRIAYPEKNYRMYKGTCPYSFQYPVYAEIGPDSTALAEPCWQNINYPQFNATLHLSYHVIDSKKTFNALTEDARTFAFKHTTKATSIDEGRIADPKRSLYGIYYTIAGNTASSVQFYLTDSSKHYLRAALYFNEEPRADSIQPVLSFIKKDIDVMIKTFHWN